MEFRGNAFLENIGAKWLARKIEEKTGIRVHSAATNLGSGQFYQDLGAGVGEPLYRGVVQPVDSAIGSATQSIQDASGGRLLIGNAYQNSKEMVTSTEGQGFIKTVQGAMEVQAGMALIGTGIGSVAGAILIGHGIDTMQAGVRQAASGQQVRTGTAQGVTAITGSETAGDIADVAIPTVAGCVGWIQGSRAAAIKAAGKEVQVVAMTRRQIEAQIGSTVQRIEQQAQVEVNIAKDWLLDRGIPVENTRQVIGELSKQSSKGGAGFLKTINDVSGGAAEQLIRQEARLLPPPQGPGPPTDRPKSTRGPMPPF
jgi:hypothetical protein